jgi:hypothetical protein
VTSTIQLGSQFGSVKWHGMSRLRLLGSAEPGHWPHWVGWIVL